MTQLAKHTPGPWRIIEQTRIEADNYGLIASLRGEISQHYKTTTDANAVLIALSPSMAEAIYKLVMARKVSSEEFRRASYSSDVQAVFDAVFKMYGGEE